MAKHYYILARKKQSIPLGAVSHFRNTAYTQTMVFIFKVHSFIRCKIVLFYDLATRTSVYVQTYRPAEIVTLLALNKDRL